MIDLQQKIPGKPLTGIVLFILSLIITGNFEQISAEESEWIEGYSSDLGELEKSIDTDRKERVYTLKQIHSLRKAIAPVYVRVLDWRKYGQGETAMMKGILFTYEGYRKREVFLSGNFNNWKPIPMVRNSMGVYYHILEPGVYPDGNLLRDYKYKLLVDGIWSSDPSNKNRVDDGMGGYTSTYYLESVDVDRMVSVRVLQDLPAGDERIVEFRIFLPGVQTLSLVGDFNDWNPEHDLLQKGEDGVFRLQKRLGPGNYVYKYIADGKWILDKFNTQTKYDPEIDEMVSFLEVR